MPITSDIVTAVPAASGSAYGEQPIPQTVLGQPLSPFPFRSFSTDSRYLVTPAATRRIARAVPGSSSRHCFVSAISSVSAPEASSRSKRSLDSARPSNTCVLSSPIQSFTVRSSHSIAPDRTRRPVGQRYSVQAPVPAACRPGFPSRCHLRL